MTVKYKFIAADYWHYFSYLFSKTYTGKSVAFLLITLPCWAVYMKLYFTPPNTSMHHFLLHHFWMIVGEISVALVSILPLTAIVSSLRMPELSATINENYWISEGSVSIKSPWRQFSWIAEDAEYLCFIGWLRAVFIPKRAFQSSAEADVFFNTALGYWRKAKGIPTPPAPDVSGVWPPASRAGDSQEPGDKP